MQYINVILTLNLRSFGPPVSTLVRNSKTADVRVKRTESLDCATVQTGTPVKFQRDVWVIVCIWVGNWVKWGMETPGAPVYNNNESNVREFCRQKKDVNFALSNRADICNVMLRLNTTSLLGFAQPYPIHETHVFRCREVWFLWLRNPLYDMKFIYSRRLSGY